MWLSILSSDQQVLGGVAKLLNKRPQDAEASLSSAGHSINGGFFAA